MNVGELVGRAVRGRPSAPLPFWAWCVVAVFCTVLYTVAVPVLSSVYDVHLVTAFVVSTVQCGSLVVAVFRPVLGAALQLGSALALTFVTRDSADGFWPLPVAGLVSLGALVLLLGIRERWIVSVSVWWLSVLMLVAVIAATPDRYADADGWGVNLTVYASYTASVLAAAIAIGQRRRIRADLAEARRDVELEQARRIYVEERARIARELHDVVAHSMSLVHMQALSAPHRLAGAGAGQVSDEFRSIARTARTALREMRQMLGALRADDGEADLAPQPQVRDLPALAELTRRAGIPVDLEVDDAAAETSPIVQLTAFRIVQEALSNVVRHAPGAHTRVSVRIDGALLRLSVRNARPAATAGGPAGPDVGGHGLRGMRERVDLLGGDLSAGPTDDGGFAVAVTVPVTTLDQPVEPR